MLILKLENISAFYGNIQALTNVNIEIYKGEIVALIGANGAGKTTTLMTISGIISQKSGKIFFMGEDLQNKPPEKIVSFGISQVPEGRHIFPKLTVAENIEIGAFLRKDKKKIKEDIEYIYDIFPILEKRRYQKGGTLSGGEQQMLAISRALMARPRLLLLDEPSLGLAPIMVKQMFEIIKKINKENSTTVFLVEQNANIALKASSRGYVMENGKIIFSGPSKELIKNKKIKSAYLGL